MSARSKSPTRLWRKGLLIAATLSLNGCAGIQSALDPAGPQSGRISKLWWLMFWISSAVFVLVMIFLLVAALRKRPHEEIPDGDGGRERKAARVVTGAVVVTIIILFVLLVVDNFTGQALYSLSSPDPLTIRVTGYQWWWKVEYEDPIASNIIITANEIHIPIGQPVHLKLRSNDVIHSFWVPNLHGKKDLIPGYETDTWFQADRPGAFRGQCAEFCGHQHAHMAFLVVAHTPEEFQSWLYAQRLPAAQPADPAQQRGQQVFLSSPCVMCHTIRGTQASGNVAPDLTHIASRQTIAAGTLPLTRGHLGGWINNPQDIKPGTRMPPNNLDPQDLQALLSYLESLK